MPQGGLVKTARAGWKFVWLQMMRELAPQSPDGAYVRCVYIAANVCRRCFCFCSPPTDGCRTALWMLHSCGRAERGGMSGGWIAWVEVRKGRNPALLQAAVPIFTLVYSMQFTHLLEAEEHCEQHYSSSQGMVIS